MLQSWGNSSRLLRRKKLPMGMSHCAGFSNKWVATSGVSIRMLRNLGIANRRLLRPTRCDQ